MKFTMEKFHEIYDSICKGIKPSFEEFLFFVEGYGEVEFYYDYDKYSIDRCKRDNVSTKYELWNERTGQMMKAYNSLDEFARRANIKGMLLCDIWKDIYDVNGLD